MVANVSTLFRRLAYKLPAVEDNKDFESMASLLPRDRFGCTFWGNSSDFSITTIALLGPSFVIFGLARDYAQKRKRIRISHPWFLRKEAVALIVFPG